jgi:hypothetical protein
MALFWTSWVMCNAAESAKLGSAEMARELARMSREIDRSGQRSFIMSDFGVVV